jgi:hypothetical protein
MQSFTLVGPLPAKKRGQNARQPAAGRFDEFLMTALPMSMARRIKAFGGRVNF